MQQKCVVCGRGSDEVLIYKGVCLDCFLRDTKTFTFKEKSVHFTFCPVCGDHTYKGRWRRSDDVSILKSDFKNIVLSNIRVNVEGEIVSIEFKSDVLDFIKYSGNRRIDGNIKIKLYGYDFVVERSMYTYVDVEHKLCDRCLNEVSGNYEAILQIRGYADKSKMNELYMVVSKSLDSAYKAGRDYRLIDQKIIDNGVDFYFSSYNEAIRIAKEIKKRFGGNLSETRKLVKIKGGKRIARHTILLKFSKD